MSHEAPEPTTPSNTPPTKVEVIYHAAEESAKYAQTAEDYATAERALTESLKNLDNTSTPPTGH